MDASPNSTATPAAPDPGWWTVDEDSSHPPTGLDELIDANERRFQPPDPTGPVYEPPWTTGPEETKPPHTVAVPPQTVAVPPQTVTEPPQTVTEPPQTVAEPPRTVSEEPSGFSYLSPEATESPLGEPHNVAAVSASVPGDAVGSSNNAEYLRRVGSDVMSGLSLFRWAPTALKAPTVQMPNLAPGEVVKRQWVTHRYWRPLGKFAATLTLTDTRVIYADESVDALGSSRVTTEVDIDSMSGLSSETSGGLHGWRLSLLVWLSLWLAFSALTGIFGDSGGTDGYESFGDSITRMVTSPSFVNWFLVALVTGGLFVSGLLNRKMSISVITEKGEVPLFTMDERGLLSRIFEAVINLFVWPISLVLLPALGIASGSKARFRPTKEANVAVDELGAAVIEMKARGVLGQ